MSAITQDELMQDLALSMSDYDQMGYVPRFRTGDPVRVMEEETEAYGVVAYTPYRESTTVAVLLAGHKTVIRFAQADVEVTA